MLPLDSQLKETLLAALLPLAEAWSGVKLVGVDKDVYRYIVIIYYIYYPCPGGHVSVRGAEVRQRVVAGGARGPAAQPRGEVGRGHVTRGPVYLYTVHVLAPSCTWTTPPPRRRGRCSCWTVRAAPPPSPWSQAPWCGTSPPGSHTADHPGDYNLQSDIYYQLVTNYYCQVPGTILRQRLRPLQARGPAVVRRGGDGGQVSSDWWRAVT